MQREAREWSAPEPIRALIWWPALAFAIAIALPDALWLILVAGGALAVCGVARSVLGTRRSQDAPAELVEAREPANADAAA